MAFQRFTNPVTFYYRKDLQVTKHGEFKAGVDLDFGAPVKRDYTTGLLQPATNSTEFEGVVDKILLDVQQTDKGRLKVKAGERCRIGVGKDYEIVIKGLASADSALNKGDVVEVSNGKFVKKNTGARVGQVVDKYANGELVIKID